MGDSLASRSVLEGYLAAVQQAQVMVRYWCVCGLRIENASASRSTTVFCASSWIAKKLHFVIYRMSRPVCVKVMFRAWHRRRLVSSARHRSRVAKESRRRYRFCGASTEGCHREGCLIRSSLYAARESEDYRCSCR